MSLTEYYSSEIDVVLSIIDSFYEFENNKERQEWERARFIAYMTIKPHDIKKKFKKPSDIIRLGWEQQKIENEIKDLKTKMELSRKNEQALYNKLMR